MFLNDKKKYFTVTGNGKSEIAAQHQENNMRQMGDTIFIFQNTLSLWHSFKDKLMITVMPMLSKI